MRDSFPYSMREYHIEGVSRVEFESRQLLLERLPSIIRVPYYWGWAIFSGIIFLGTSIAIFHFENSFSYVPSTLILSILIAQQPIVIIWARRRIEVLKEYLLDIIDLQKDEIFKWYEDQMSIIFDEKRMLMTGVLVTIFVHLIGFDQFGFDFSSPYSDVILRGEFIFAHVLMGAGLYPLICTAYMVTKISKLPMNINIILSRNLQMKGLLYSKFTICAASVYILWGCFHLSTPDKLSTIWRIGWFSFFAILLLAYFILPQYSIHQIIMETKREKLQIFSKRLSTKAAEAFSNPTRSNIFCLRNYLDIERQLDEMCVWPFGSYEILHIVLIVIIPFVVVLLEIVFGIIR